MDKNSIIGFVLIGLILLGFSFFQTREAKERAKQQAQLDSIALAQRIASGEIDTTGTTIITYYSGFRAGFCFSAGATDLVFSASLPAAAKTWMIIPLGIAAFLVFYFVFYFAIRSTEIPILKRQMSTRTRRGCRDRKTLTDQFWARLEQMERS